MAVTLLGNGQAIVQIIQSVKTDTFSTTSTTPVDVTGLSVSITPTSSSNRIFVTAQITWGLSTGVAYLVGFLLVRNSTSILIADAAGSRSRWTIGSQGAANADVTPTAIISFLDSPATTSATTYKIQMATESPQTAYINRASETDGDASITGRFTSTITVMEVSG